MSSSDGALGFDLEFILVCVHSVLHARSVYPSNIFEQRRYLGITIWQSRHPEVNEYILKVLQNAKSLFVEGLIDRVIVSIDDKDERPIEHITVKLSREKESLVTDLIQEEYRSTLLRLGMLDRLGSKLPEDYNWKLMVVTKVPTTTSNQELMNRTLTDGNWFVDNNKLSEQAALFQRYHSQPDGEETAPPQPKLVPLKSYRDEHVNLSVYCHVFT